MTAAHGRADRAGTAVPPVDAPAAPSAPHRRIRPGYAVAAGALVVAIGGGATWYALSSGSAPPHTGGAAPVTTTAITRGDVVDTESVDGTLSYAHERSLTTPASGVVTWAPGSGTTIRRGESLMRVNDRPVTLMYGSMPLYRSLHSGVSDGNDVRQLEANLAALGYGPDMTVDDEFTAATADAVRDWQEDRGLPETGGVDRSQVVFAAGSVRVADVKAAKGDQVHAGSPAMTVTDTTRTVHVDLEADKQDLVKKGDKVTVELPDGRTVKGRISSVGSVASAGHGDDPASVDVYVKLSGDDVGRLDKAPVSVELTSDRAKDVLSVPVEALLALREGGYGVEVVSGKAHRIVAVKTGTYGGGRVEISGDGLRAGTKVEVPAS